MNDEWETPDDLFNKLNREFNFVIDIAANALNKKCAFYLGDYPQNALNYSWKKVWDAWVTTEDRNGAIWMNPPYSRGNIEKFMALASFNSQYFPIVCLVRFDPSTKWYQKYVHDVVDEVRMLSRRVKFVGAPSAYNFPSAIVVYRPETYNKLNHTKYTLYNW